MKGVVIIDDDLVVFGNNQDGHDKHFQSLLESCRSLGVKLGMDLDAITFKGHNKEGIAIDPEKVRAVPETVGTPEDFWVWPTM